MSHLHSLLLASVAASLMALPASAQIRQTAQERAGVETGSKSMNPHTGAAEIKKDLQNADDQARAANIAEGSKEVKQLGKKLPAGAGTQKPTIAGDDNGQLALHKKAARKKYCEDTCNPKIPMGSGQQYGGVSTPFGSTQGADPMAGQGTGKAAEYIAQCIKDCMAGTGIFSGDLNKSLEGTTEEKHKP